MNLQEQEQMEYEAGWATEQQNVHAISSMKVNEKNSQNGIAALLAAGRFVAVGEHPAFCEHTDAYCGVHRWVSAHFATREEAEKHLTGLHEKGLMDPESFYEVLPRAQAPVVHLAIDLNDELPF